MNMVVKCIVRKKWVVSCCAFGCKNCHGERAGVRFYRFPTMDHARRLQWVKEGTGCRQYITDHFVSGMYVSCGIEQPRIQEFVMGGLN